MAGLKHTMGAIPGGSTRRVYGNAFHDGSRWWVNVGGNLLDARWCAGVRPQQGLNVVVDITNDGQGQSTALVIDAYVDQPRPGTGTVQDILPAGPAIEIVFLADDGVTYQTDQFIGTFNLGDPVYLNWDADKPTIMGKIGALAAPPTPTPPPPAPTAAASGEVSLIATASDTWGVGGWGRWASSQYGGEDVYTGTWGGYTLTGAWFYGAPKPELQGKTITRIQFRLPNRMNVGASGSAMIHIYAHTSGSRTGSDVSRVAGPFDVSIPQGSGPSWHDLPLSFAAALAGGGGISIAGDPYAAFNSRLDDPESGKLLITWSS